MDSITELRKAIDDRLNTAEQLGLAAMTLRKEAETLKAALDILSTKKEDPQHIEEDWGDPVPTPEPSTKYGEVKGAVLKFIQSFGHENFTVNEAASFVSGCLPSFSVETGKANISAYLKEFSENGPINLIEPGRGRLPAVYKLKK